MPKYGYSASDRAHQIIMDGLETPDDGTMPNRSERINELVELGGAVESAFDAAQIPANRRGPGDVDLLIQAGAKRMREQGVL